MNALRSFAADGPVPLFAAVGQDAGAAVADLCLSPSITRVASPRHASILLVAGEVRVADREALRRLHDQIPHPRATLWWGSTESDGAKQATTLAADEDPLPPLRSLYRRLMTQELPSEAHLLPDEPPVPWRGLGEHGQGGKGMMGGTPYGRPMAMTADDLRDGLALDQYTVELGPFLPTLPPGLVLQITLQGDVIQRAKVIQPPYLPSSNTGVFGPWSAAAEIHLERAHAAHRLRGIAGLLTLLQLLPQAELCLRLALSVTRGATLSLRDVRKALRRSGAFVAIPPELGRIDCSPASALGGIALTARGRMSQWFDEAELALRAASMLDPPRADATLHDTRTRMPERPPGSESRFAFLFTELLVGLEWGEALLVIASFDVSALCRMSPARIPNETAERDYRPKHATGHAR